MTIKSDRWIVEQASKGMIEPFEAGQIRTNEDGGKVISYGTSSYGYCLLYTSPSPRDRQKSRMPSSA